MSRRSDLRATPQLPDIDELEALAAGKPSEQGAWWITLQVVEHILEEGVVRDRITGAPLVTSAQAVLAALNPASWARRRPMPNDGLSMATELALEPLQHILGTHRTRLLREHKSLPLPSLREMDAACMTWLARQPGRSAREKLGSKSHALGVVRTFTADTPENRMAALVVRMLSRRIGDRLEYRASYDEEGAVLPALEEMAELSDRALRRSFLADVQPGRPDRPNNVLLSDPHYSRFMRAWRVLHAEENDLPARWEGLPDTLLDAIFLLVVASLTNRTDAVVWERPVRRLDEGTRGWEILGEGWQPWRSFWMVARLSPPRLVRVERLDNSVLVSVRDLVGVGCLPPNSTSKTSFQIALPPDATLQGHRGIPLAVRRDEGGAKLHQADLEGFRMVVKAIARNLLAPTPLEDRIVRTLAEDDIEAGIDLGASPPWIAAKSATWQTQTPTAAWRCTLPEGDDFWTSGTDRTHLDVLAPFVAQASLNEAFSPEPGEHARGIRSSVEFLEALAREVQPPASSRIAYTVPDAVDDFTQRALRATIRSNFGATYPIWRSVAAVLGWQVGESFEAAKVGEGDIVVVLDAGALTLTTTILVARQDKLLLARRPESGGIYWERRPPLPTEDEDDELTWTSLLRQYVLGILAKQAGKETTEAEKDLLASYLVERGFAGSLWFGRRIDPIPVHDRWLILAADEAVKKECLTRWEKDFAASLIRWRRHTPLMDTLASLGNGNRTLLLVGRPFQEARRNKELGKAIGDIFDRGERNAQINFIDGDSGSLAQGSLEFVRRMNKGLPAWREWLPDLFLEVVRNGRWEELKLLDEGQAPSGTGEALRVEVNENLVLPAGVSSYVFPLLRGRRNRRPLAWNLRLNSPAFPLHQNLRVAMELTYQYGLDDSYTLSVFPADQEAGAPAEMTATWESAGQTWDPAAAVGAIPNFPQRQAATPAEIVQWIGRVAPRAPFEANLATAENATAFAAQLRRLAYAVLQLERLGGLANAQRSALMSNSAGYFSHLTNLALMDLRQVPAERRNQVERCSDRAFVCLAGFGDHAPDEILRALDVGGRQWARPAPGDLRALSRFVRVTNDRQVLPEFIKIVKRCLEDPDDLTRYNASLESLAESLWGRADFVQDLASQWPGVTDSLTRTVKRDLLRMTWSIAASLEKKEGDKAKRLGHPFQNTCEVLLGLLRLRGSSEGAGLEQGRPHLLEIARTLRQLDSLFARIQWEVKPGHVNVAASKPPHLARVSDLVYVLNGFLVGFEDAGLVRIEEERDE